MDRFGPAFAAIRQDSPTVTQDQLLFQDIPHTEPLTSDGSSGRSSKTRQEKSSKVQTHTFTDFPHPPDSDEEDKTDLLEGKQRQPSFWMFEYYQSFFDVDTRQVLKRIAGSLYPNPRSNYLQTMIRPKPDLYGPFWICTTLVFTIAVAGNLSNYLWLHNAQTQFEWKYDFHKVTFATTAIFSYWWLIPTLLYCLLWWRGNQAGFTYTELICIYGYSLAIYIPISLLWVINVTWLQWLLVMLGMALSGTVLMLTVSPAFKHDKKQIFIGTMVFVMAMHGLLAVGFMLYFFHIPSIDMSAFSSASPLGNVTTTALGQRTTFALTTPIPSVTQSRPA
jgi:hypothetical protein